MAAEAESKSRREKFAKATYEFQTRRRQSKKRRGISIADIIVV